MRILYFILLLTLFTSGVFGQKVTLSGYLKDEKSGEALIGATVYVPELKIGVVTNFYGFYSLTIPKGNYSVEVSYIGYETTSQKLNISEDKTLTFKMKDATEMIDEVVVTSEAKNKNVESVSMSMEKVSVKTIKKLPAFMGEVDVIKSIQLLPGIQSGGEGSSGLYVRGGGPDENLLLLDEAPVYNASHLMGFFSVFNADAIKDIQVYKGGIPAMYGGKASSVIDIRQKDGNSQEYHVSAGIGNLSSRLTVEGPIIKDKWSFIVSGRRTYLDVLGKAAGIDALENNKLYFYDLNGKSNLIINDKNRIYFSTYTGDDFFSLGSSIFMRWGNTTFTTRWNHVYGSKVFSNLSLIYSRYDYNIGVPEGGSSDFDWTSMIRDWNLKYDFTYFLNPTNQVKFGADIAYHHFEPGKIKTSEDGDILNLKLNSYNAVDVSPYISNEQKLGGRITLQYGLRLSYFQQVGDGEVRSYTDGSLTEISEIQSYDNFEKIGEPFIYLEPRASFKYTLGPTSSLKGSYNRMVQNLHLISNTTSPMPLDIWLPTSKYIKPLIADQVALGYFRNFMNNAIETSVEAYYKDMNNVLDYINGADLFLNESIETELRHGNGKSYGVEVLIKKQQGKITGWIGYTLSKTTRHIKDTLVNEGKEYPATYDRTHDLSVVLSYQINKYWNISTSFVYATGNPTTYPIGKYRIGSSANDGTPLQEGGKQEYIYSDRNEYRLPDYHRMDLSVTYDWKKNDYRKFKQSINLSLYNVYMRRNAYSIYPEENEDNPNVTDFVRLSIIGSMVPSITYNINF